MDNIDDAETNAKISDSAYSNSCSNSQSRRSHSSKSTHSGSNSSGSSGYGGKASTSGSSNALGQPPKKDKESKKKKLSQAEAKAAEATPEDEQLRTPEPAHILASPKEESDNVDESNMDVEMPEKVSVNMDILPLETANNDEEALALQPVGNAESFVTSQPPPTNSADGFSCVISMHDGVVTYASASITETLGYPREIWTGRSFINMVHPKDHKTFSSLITNGMAFPKLENGKTEKGQTFIPGSTMVCRLRRYRNLNGAFGIKNYIVMYAPFLLKFYFKDHSDHDVNIVYLILQATHYFSAFKTPNELVPKPVSFVIKHGPDGVLEYIDPESAPYMGYLPQDIQDKNALHLYHPDDLPYLRYIYESIVREGKVSSSRPYRLMTQNGDYIKVETEWSSVVNPWSMKLEFVIAKHHILEGPTNPDVFQSPGLGKSYRMSEAENYKIQAFRDTIINVMKEVRTRSAEVAKGKRCQDLDSFMENLIEETPKQDDDLRMELQDRDHSCFERDSVMLGGISPHHDSDSKSSIETPLSYNQLNYNENLQRYFDSQEPLGLENVPPTEGCIESRLAHVPYPSSRSQSPMALNSQDNDMSSNSSAMAIYVSSPGPPADYQIAEHAEFQLHKLSKNALDKHNSKMEKELVKMHRESRSSKGDREKASNETRKKKKEHFARCNATFHPTSAGDESTERKHRISAKGKQQGVKRPSKPQITDTHAQKHHCSSPRERRRPHVTRTPPPAQPSVPSTTTTATTNWQSTQNVNHFNMFGVGIPQQMPMLNHMPTMPVASSTNCPKTLPTYTNRVPPMQGASVPSSRCPPASVPIPGVARYPTVSRYPTVPMPPTAYPRSNIYPGQAAMPGMPCTSGVPPMSAAYGCHMPGPSAMPSAPVMPSMYPVYYSPVTNTTPSTSKQQPFPSTSAYQPYQPQMPYVVHGHPISMVYGQPFMYSPVNPQMYPMPQNYVTEQLMHQCTSSINSLPLSDCNIDQTAELVQSSSSNSMCGNSQKARTSDDNTDRTDGESSYSSFYSSFFKTDSGSAEDSGDQFNKPNDVKNRFWTKAMPGDDDPSFQGTKRPVKKFARKKMDAPWNEEVNLTSELIYKYQLRTKPVHEVLEADKQKLKSMAQQSPMVNEQLGQLYLDLQLQGVAARLTLEEGITSSSSSGEEPMPMPMSCKTKRKHEFSKLVIIHEENAPLPTPDSGLLIPESEIETTPSRKTS